MAGNRKQLPEVGPPGQPFEVEWRLYAPREGQEEAVAVPLSPLLIRMRRIVGEEFFTQTTLLPLKRFMEALFFAGPGCVLLGLYLPRGGGLLIWLGLLCLAMASPYWFAPHWLCRRYLRYRGYEEVGSVKARDFESALAATK